MKNKQQVPVFNPHAEEIIRPLCAALERCNLADAKGSTIPPEFASYALPRSSGPALAGVLGVYGHTLEALKIAIRLIHPKIAPFVGQQDIQWGQEATRYLDVCKYVADLLEEHRASHFMHAPIGSEIRYSGGVALKVADRHASFIADVDGNPVEYTSDRGAWKYALTLPASNVDPVKVLDQTAQGPITPKEARELGCERIRKLMKQLEKLTRAYEELEGFDDHDEYIDTLKGIGILEYRMQQDCFGEEPDEILQAITDLCAEIVKVGGLMAESAA